MLHFRVGGLGRPLEAAQGDITISTIGTIIITIIISTITISTITITSTIAIIARDSPSLFPSLLLLVVIDAI
jgi:hypothetical protein